MSVLLSYGARLARIELEKKPLCLVEKKRSPNQKKPDAFVGKINLQPTRPVLDAREIDGLIALYLADTERRTEPGTALGYSYKLAFFQRWWQVAGPPLAYLLEKSHLDEFERWLHSQCNARGIPLSYHSRDDVLRRLRQVLRWAYLHNYIDERDYSPWVPAARGAPPKREAITLSHLQQLFDAAGDSPYAARDRTLLAVFIGTGMRRGEAASVKVEKIRIKADHSGVIDVTGKRTRANASGERTVAFDAACGRYLVAYLELSGLVSGPLFVGPQGALSAQGIYKAVKRCIKLAGLEDYIQGCHDLRRAFATHFRRAHKGEGYDDLLRRQLGHAHYAMTTAYTLLDIDDVSSILTSPLAQIMEAAGCELRAASQEKPAAHGPQPAAAVQDIAKN